MDSTNLSSLPEEEDKEEQQRQHSSLCSFASVPTRPPTQCSSQKYSPLDWRGFFDEEKDICIPDLNDVFHVYMAGTEGPVVFCLHGGGYSGLSFALSANKIKERTRVVAMDLRGHGKSKTDNDLDLSIETMCNDVTAILKEMYGESPPAIILVGHSMGGSVAVHVAAKKTLPSLAGLVVVDVVEGTAMASLVHMQKILSSRMQHFSSIEKADLKNGRRICGGYEAGGLYYSDSDILAAIVKQTKDVYRLHCSLGHPSIETLSFFLYLKPISFNMKHVS